jgi:hydrogenase maturation protease
MRDVRLLVCGEPLRGDDALAAAIVDALPATTRHLVTLWHVAAPMPEDLVDAPGPVIILDAVRGPAPGEVIDLPLAALLAPEHETAAASSHALPLPAVIGIVEQVRGSLPEGRFIGIAATRFTLGAPLSASVRMALPAATARLGHWIRVLAHAHAVPSCA